MNNRVYAETGNVVDDVKYRWKVLWASIAGYAMDGLDMLGFFTSG